MPNPIEPGTIVRVKAGGLLVRRGSPAILLHMQENGIRVLTDGGTASAIRHQIAVPKIPLPNFEPMRLRLAYGMWTEQDGSKVLFSRDYCPIWHISPDGRAEPDDPWRWISYVGEAIYFFGDTSPPWRNTNKEREIEQRMTELGVTGTPKLMRVIPLLVQGRAETIREAVRLMVPAGATPYPNL